MVCAKLHIICGNCGCNNMFEFTEPSDVCCKNCSTIHNIYDNMENEEPSCKCCHCPTAEASLNEEGLCEDCVWEYNPDDDNWIGAAG